MNDLRKVKKGSLRIPKGKRKLRRKGDYKRALLNPKLQMDHTVEKFFKNVFTGINREDLHILKNKVVSELSAKNVKYKLKEFGDIMDNLAAINMKRSIQNKIISGLVDYISSGNLKNASLIEKIANIDLRTASEGRIYQMLIKRNPKTERKYNGNRKSFTSKASRNGNLGEFNVYNTNLELSVIDSQGRENKITQSSIGYRSCMNSKQLNSIKVPPTF